jgi:hypothetical protein
VWEWNGDLSFPKIISARSDDAAAPATLRSGAGSPRTRAAIVDRCGDGQPTNVVISRVTVLDSSTIDPDAAAAVAHVSQSATGAIRVTMHDKGAALERLARALGMFKDRLEVASDGKPVAPIINLYSYPGPASDAK